MNLKIKAAAYVAALLSLAIACSVITGMSLCYLSDTLGETAVASGILILFILLVIGKVSSVLYCYRLAELESLAKVEPTDGNT